MIDAVGVFGDLHAVDVTAFLGTSPWRLPSSIDRSRLSALADRLGLGHLCVSHLASVYGFDTRCGNEALFTATAEDPRLGPTPVINPAEPGWERELSWSAERGARGLRLVPGYHGYAVTHPATRDLIDAARSLNVAVHLTVAIDDPRERHRRFAVDEITTDCVADFLRTATGVAVVLSGLRAADWTEVSTHLDHGHDLDRALVDLWRMNGPVQVIAQLCRDGWSSTLAYGSCLPVQEALASAYQLGAAGISDSERAALAGANACRVLQIPDHH